jgi:hypothetical protein
VGIREVASARDRIWAFSLFLFAAAVAPFATLRLVVESGLHAAQLPVRLTISFCAAAALAGLIAGVLGAFPGNARRLLSAAAALINAAALVFILNRFLLWGV